MQYQMGAWALTAWIIPVDGDKPQNWDIAKENKFWDTKLRFGIKQGDELYFWLTRGRLDNPRTGFLGYAIATSDGSTVDERFMPWTDPESGYRERFNFQLHSEQIHDRPGWKEVSKELQTGAFPQIPREFPKDHQRRYLRGLFTPADHTLELPHIEIEIPNIELISGEDRRKRSERAVVEREGQPGFRNRLLKAYDRRCCVTGTDVIAALDAAHITPYLGKLSNPMQNGILLRTDIHKLYDRHLITILDDYTVALAPSIRTSNTYQGLHGREITLPIAHIHRPDRAALSLHRSNCNWIN
ncbi:HNH endonuclease [Rhodococcus sp. OK611]|uniref:HNH endonuclease n=1 Tax=unclassified Rhodococcus (in: high G+C Gram-positive bacteria) TaxID=192944 RepID=UPI000BD8C5F5|nr:MULTISPECIES: HNH endonuclease [unclassified Rhodococcus (in: high G+C Gram-positive bacteria)]PTR36694.1 HNH endonuclease [Rhodococcus sp. OK611]SNX93788.1 HNH endonuclease [Rhodococcus sp. OK270]